MKLSITKNIVVLLWVTSAIDAVDWQTTAVVSLTSSYLGCRYFKKKEHHHTPQFWCDVASGAGISFLIGRCLDRCLAFQAQSMRDGLSASWYIPGYEEASAHVGSLPYSQAENSTICGMKFESIAILVMSTLSSVLVAHLQTGWQWELQQEQLYGAEAQQRRAHRFQQAMTEQQQLFQTRERLASQEFLAQENRKHRANLEQLHAASEQERHAKALEEAANERARNAKADELFMAQFQTNGAHLPDRTDIGYIPAPLQELLSALDTDSFIVHHLLLRGYAGSGKSHSIKIVARELQKRYEATGKEVEIFTVHQGKLCSRYLGETLVNLERFFRCVEERVQQGIEVIILWDEIDVLTRGSTSDDSAAQDINFTVGGLKEIIERLPAQVRIFATTNHPDKINEAIKSRFDSGCELKLPTEAERERVLRFWVQDDGLQRSRLWKSYAKKMHGWSIRDLHHFFTNAKKYSNGSFDKHSLKTAFEESVRARKDEKKDFSTYETGWDKTKRYVQGVVSTVLTGIAHSLGGVMTSWLAWR